MIFIRTFFATAFSFVFTGVASAQLTAHKTAEPIIASSALLQLMPAVKQAHAVGHFHDPFGLIETPGLRIVGQSSLDRRAALEARLQEVFGRSLQSVLHAKESGAGLILFDGKTFRPSEELFLGPSLTPRPLLEKTRVVLLKIQSDALELTLVNLDERRREENVRLVLDRQFVP